MNKYPFRPEADSLIITLETTKESHTVKIQDGDTLDFYYKKRKVPDLRLTFNKGILTIKNRKLLKKERT